MRNTTRLRDKLLREWLYNDRIREQGRRLPGTYPSYRLPGVTTVEEAHRVDQDEMARGAVVYYARRHSDDLIKVGTTVNLDARERYLTRVYGPIGIEAFEPGSYALERLRHNQFAEVRAMPADGVPGGTEWFHPLDPIEDHIVRLWHEEWAAERAAA